MTDRVDTGLATLLASQYELERELGRGGMGVVYLAREVKLGRRVAVKVLPPTFAANAELRERFLREARTAAHLSHPNIVPVYSADEIGGYAYFVMAFVEGESLAERLRRVGVLSPGETVRVLREASWALAYAHARGVVHRDVKPENLMLDKGTGRAIVTDFGIARDLTASKLTQDGYVLGTVHYMSPEQVAGDALDGRSDLYALGVIGFECLAGDLPFDAAQASAVIVQHATEPAPRLRSRARDVPEKLAAVIDRCLSKDPADRFPTGEALADALTAALEGDVSDQTDPESQQVVSEEEARAIWHRAAELQAEAATRIRQRYRASDPLDDPTRHVPTSSYRLVEVERAATEAGIGAEFVALAAAERLSADPQATAAASGREERIWEIMLGSRQRSLSRSRLIKGNPRQVLEAIGQVFPEFPWSLTLRDTVGGHPLDGGVMVFDVRRLSAGDGMARGGISMLSYRLTQIDLLQLNVAIRSTATGETEVSVSGDLRPGLRKNWVFDRATASVAGVIGGGIGGALALGPLGLVPALAAGPIVGGAALLGGLSLGAYRLAYRHALRKSGDELDKLLTAIESSLRSQAVFGGVRPLALRRPPDGPRETTP
ncbi:MAG: serine/threonine-protein kinase [Gemmatimonadales bacterium]